MIEVLVACLGVSGIIAGSAEAAHLAHCWGPRAVQALTRCARYCFTHRAIASALVTVALVGTLIGFTAIQGGTAL